MARKTKNPHIVQLGVYMPDMVAQRLRLEAARTNHSMSWIVTELVMREFKIPQEEVDKARGYSLPGRFSDRKGDWTPRKNNPESLGLCPVCEEEPARSTDPDRLCVRCRTLVNRNKR